MKSLLSIGILLLPLLDLTAVPLIREKVTVDGDLSDPVWQKVEWRSGFTQLGSKTPAAAQTRFKTFHDGSRIYFAVECDEPEMSKLRTAWNPGSWQNDSIEINLVPDPKILSFYKISVDANGGFQDLFGQDDNTDRGIYQFNAAWRSSSQVKSRKEQDKCEMVLVAAGNDESGDFGGGEHGTCADDGEGDDAAEDHKPFFHIYLLKPGNPVDLDTAYVRSNAPFAQAYV